MLAPVRCLVVDPAVARDVVAPAYDSLTPAEREAWADSHPLSWLNCTRVRVNGSPAAERTAMRQNRAAFDVILGSGVFTRHERALFVYRLTDGTHRQTGIVGQVPTDFIGTPRLRVHEGVQPRRVETLRLHLEVVGATSSPVAMTWRSDESIDATLSRPTSAAPLVDVVDDEGIRQELWPVTDEGAVDALTGAVGSAPLYVVDGHHRSAAAAEFVANAPSRSEHDRHLLVAAFPQHHLQVAPFHRVLHAEVDVAALRNAHPIAAPRLQHGTTTVVDTAGRWWQVDLDGRPGDLDVERLHASVLEDQLGVAADDSRLESVAGRDGLAQFAVRARGATGFALAPTGMTQILDRADEGRVMPSKATYFHPKVRSGLLARLHVPEDEARMA